MIYRSWFEGKMSEFKWQFFCFIANKNRLAKSELFEWRNRPFQVSVRRLLCLKPRPFRSCLAVVASVLRRFVLNLKTNISIGTICRPIRRRL
ncbi:hypothetical protein MFFC18_14300 [Mariniblastus fucicola]|uniref:Uncharacterized protein n=1 Tax=Mariniblastus fucicola TaxID=980251 RepID=A0A5B9P9F9_9BACT|nr:hypothetical protein MFFC18_14300 [Mariniblastus fucicola]